MNHDVLIAVIAATPGFIGAVAAIVKLMQVEVKMNGRLTELLELTKKSSHSEGVKDQKATQVREDKEEHLRGYGP